MTLNNDLLFIGSLIFIGAGVFTLSKYNIFTTTVNKNDSLINTNSLSNLDSNIPLNNLPNHNYVDAAVQTGNISVEANIQVEASIQAANTLVNTGMQTSSRMWLESIKNWINEILGTGTTYNPQGQYVDAGVQTGTRSSWELFKDSLNKFFNLETGSVNTPSNVRIDTWRSRLDSNQSIDLHDSESPLTNLRFGTDSPLQNLITPDDSASQMVEPVLQNVEPVLQNVEPARVYDMNNPKDVLDLMIDPTVVLIMNL